MTKELIAVGNQGGGKRVWSPAPVPVSEHSEPADEETQHATGWVSRVAIHFHPKKNVNMGFSGFFLLVTPIRRQTFSVESKPFFKKITPI